MTTYLMNCRSVSFVFALFIGIFLFGCTASPVPTTTPARPPTLLPTDAPTATNIPPTPELPTLVSTLEIATPHFTAPTAGTPRPTAFGTPVPSQGTMVVKVFLVALNDNGKSGKKIGCDDSVVGVNRPIPATSAPLTAALKELLSIRQQKYGESGLYNALYQSNLKVAGVSLANKRATVNLTGTFLLGGVCDSPRFVAQIQETVLQFPTVSQVAVTINGVPLEKILSEKGG